MTRGFYNGVVLFVLLFALLSYAELHFRGHLFEALGLDAEGDGAKCKE